MGDSITWAVLLDGLLAAVAGGVVAAVTAWWVVTQTTKHERAARLEDRLRAATIDISAYGQQLADELDDGQFEPARVTWFKFRVAVGRLMAEADDQGRPGVREWLSSTVGPWYFVFVALGSDLEKVLTLRSEVLSTCGTVSRWRQEGFPNWSEAEFAEVMSR